MSNKQFISNLSSTYADVRRLDVKKINLKGKNILEYIKESVPTIKHSQDTRETVTENDLWGQWVETLEDGTIIIHDGEVTNPNKDTYDAWNYNITKVENNKAYEGDALYANIQTEKIKNGNCMFQSCRDLRSFDSNLSYIVDGNSMFCGCESLTSFASDLSSLKNGESMFSRSSIISFESDLSSLTSCDHMFGDCYSLNTFTSNLPSLQTGDYMFINCGSLTSFTSNLNSLQTGRYMFASCHGLTDFNADLSSLTNGYCMFPECHSLSTFTSDLSSLTNGKMMFDSCENLTTFTSDLPSLIDGNNMFCYCSNLTSFTGDLSSLLVGASMFDCCDNLTSFTSTLSSLVNGSGMFWSCKLDSDSLLHIAESIRDVRDLTDGDLVDGITSAQVYKVIHIGLGHEPTEEDIELLTEIYNKGWQVYTGVNSDGAEDRFEPTALIPMDGEETIAPTPYWAKPRETDEKHARYIGEDGKYYIILGGNYIFVNDPETYGLFVSEEDAAANMRLTKIKKN